MPPEQLLHSAVAVPGGRASCLVGYHSAIAFALIDRVIAVYCLLLLHQQHACHWTDPSHGQQIPALEHRLLIY